MNCLILNALIKSLRHRGKKSFKQPTKGDARKGITSTNSPERTKERKLHTAVGSVILKSPEMASAEDKSTPPQTSEPTSSFERCSPCKYTIFGCHESKTL